MKKVFLVISFIIFAVLCSFVTTHADAAPTVTMEQGASIRTTGNQGIRFRATASNFPAGSSHGFFLVLGNVDKADIVSAVSTNPYGKINNNAVLKKVVEGNDLVFSIVIYGIDSEHYEQKITALAYIELSNGTYVFPEATVSRDIMEVARKAYESGNNESFIADLFHSKYVNTKYHLGYSYETINEIKEELLYDFNTYNSSSYDYGYLKDNALNAALKESFSAFIGNSVYSSKWYWFFDFIANFRIERNDEIEAFATDNYDYYIKNQNITYYTPCMKAIVENYASASSMTGYGTSESLWLLETVAFFAHDGFNYYNAFTVDWAQSTYNDIYQEILDMSNEIRGETTLKNVDITYVPARTGYTFVGWYTADNNSFISKKTKTSEDSEDLYAAWSKAKTYYVDSTLDGSITNPRHEDLIFEYNVNAFDTIEKAMAMCSSGGTIYINSGTYATNLTISYDGVSLIGANGGISGSAARNPETIFNGKITISKGVSNFVIDGLKFTGNSQIVNVVGDAGTANAPATNINGFKFINNYVNVSVPSGTKNGNDPEVGNGFICFNENSSSYSHDLVFDNNYFEATNNSSSYSAFVWLNNLYNLTFTNNKIVKAPSTALRIDDKTKGASGEYIIIKNNEISNVGKNGIDIDWLSPLPKNSSGRVDISNNTLTNISNLAVYLGKFNNDDSYEYIKVDNNVFNGFTNGVYVARSITNATVSVSGNEFYGNPTTYYIKLDNAEATNPKAVNGLENTYCNLNGELNANYKDKLVGSIQSSSLFYITHSGNGTIKVGDTYVLTSNLTKNITWSSSAPLVASVTNGVVTANSEGNSIITATAANGDTATIGVTVYDPAEVSDLMQLLIDNHRGTIWNENITYIGYEGNKVNNVNGSANNYYAGTRPATNNSKTLSQSADNYSGISITSLQFITVHDTGSSSGSALANANWCVNASNKSSSWHYTVGNDGIYHHVPDNVVAWHAGDGRTTVTLQDTGIAVTKSLRYRPTITMGEDGYFYLDGAKTLVKYPAAATPATGMNTLGIGVVVKKVGGVDHYCIPTTRVTSSYGKVVAIGGGNMQSIGIETCVNNGSDVFLTWQYTAKLVAELLVTNNLGPDRVMFHNNFSNKTCPNTMINAHKTEQFLDMCYIEYMVKKYYSDYTITFTSLNNTYLDNTGRVVKNPDILTSVGYTITLSKQGQADEVITLYSSISPKVGG